MSKLKIDLYSKIFIFSNPPEEILNVLSLNRADLLSGTHITLKSNDAAERAIAPRLFVS